MSKFAAALESTLDSVDTDTTDTADTTDTTETAAAADSADADAGTETVEADASAEPDAKDDDEQEHAGNWFETKKKTDAKPAADKQKKMPDSVRSRIESETRTKVEAEYDWAKGLTKDEGQRLRNLRDLGEKDPIQLVDTMLKSLAGNAVYRSRLQSYLSDIVQPQDKKTTTTGDDDPMPGPDSENGYTVEGVKKLNEWMERQILKKVDDRMSPLLTERKQTQEQQEQQQKLDSYGQRAVRSVMSRPGFKENADAITKAYQAIPRPWSHLPMTQAENHPKYQSEAELLLEAYYTATKAAELAANKKKVADLKNKETATTVNPQGGNGGTTTKRPTGFFEALKQEAARAS